jgi:hypothetical protein
MSNVIQADRKTATKQMLANVSGKNAKNSHVFYKLVMVGAAGLEPATLSFEG